MNSRLKKEYKHKFSELRQIINGWNLIPDSPEDEFDSINHLLLSQLYKGSDKFKMTKVLHHELTVNYGFAAEFLDIDNILNEVIMWWNKNTEKPFK